MDADDEDTPENGVHLGIIYDIVCRALHLSEWQHDTQSEILLLNEMKLLTISIDKITQYSVYSRELCSMLIILVIFTGGSKYFS